MSSEGIQDSRRADGCSRKRTAAVAAVVGAAARVSRGVGLVRLVPPVPPSERGLPWPVSS